MLKNYLKEFMYKSIDYVEFKNFFNDFLIENIENGEEV